MPKMKQLKMDGAKALCFCAYTMTSGDEAMRLVILNPDASFNKQNTHYEMIQTCS